MRPVRHKDNKHPSAETVVSIGALAHQYTNLKNISVSDSILQTNTVRVVTKLIQKIFMRIKVIQMF